MNVQRPENHGVGRDYDLEERLLEYAVRVIRLVEALPNTKAGSHVAGQLLRSGTSPLPNHGEAQADDLLTSGEENEPMNHRERKERMEKTANSEVADVFVCFAFFVVGSTSANHSLSVGRWMLDVGCWS